ncbi:Crossover junction endonuclease MUS81 [Carpediemonas membranifera]|uniref:Crossover junction endonuclease MUS81 n=1 Tax=Carpediemonas membranifera TaxID=201153 RepID=A0A8J6BH73_9EUKA|nr:Crossover junction endonuclease MUS81 [Carpediemonas membranifera]|eukprot:KAG9397392.1 Crossover junction endonuclease MUS81 [Carpediemonas membranifera]
MKPTVLRYALEVLFADSGQVPLTEEDIICSMELEHDATVSQIRKELYTLVEKGVVFRAMYEGDLVYTQKEYTGPTLSPLRILVKVDFREFNSKRSSKRFNFLESLQKRHVPAIQANLAVGDVSFIHYPSGHTIPPILERKNATDLAASIVSGHYREQQTRMLAAGVSCAVVCEGMHSYMPRHACQPTVAALNTALAGTVDRGIAVVQTPDAESTAALYAAIYRKLEKKSDSELLTFCTTPTLTRPRDTLNTPTALWSRMLTVVPGAGPSVAAAVVDVYPTLMDLVRACDRDGQDAVAERLGQFRTARGRIGDVGRRVVKLVMNPTEVESRGGV